MEVFGKDWILGNFRATDFSLILVSFDYNGDSEYELGMKTSTIEEFVGNNPVPVYLGDKYEDKLRPQITLCKDPELYQQNDMHFSEKDCRWILRELTSIRGYQWMKIIDPNDMDEIWFKAKISNISYKRVGGDIIGFIIELECDSFYGYSIEYSVKINVKANVPFYVFNNTDDLTNYVLPTVTIKASKNGTLIIKNISDNNWSSEFYNLKSGEILTIDSKNEILSSTVIHSSLLNDFNLHWLRLIPDRNQFVSNTDITIMFKYRVPRKVGFR